MNIAESQQCALLFEPDAPPHPDDQFLDGPEGLMNTDENEDHSDELTESDLNFVDDSDSSSVHGPDSDFDEKKDEPEDLIQADEEFMSQMLKAEKIKKKRAKKLSFKKAGNALLCLMVCEL